jgi:sugar phosphate isomerase/epimerase
MPLQLAAFPKCYIEQIAGNRMMSVFDWIDMARSLDADGLEMYGGFFTSLDDPYIDCVDEAIHQAGFAMPMLCCSPDFTNPDPDGRKRAIDREVELIRATRQLGGPGAACRVLSGQRYPEISQGQGLAWVVDCISAVLPVAREHDIVLGLENHYKDGFWKYPEFAQKQDVFLALLDVIPERKHFGVQYDPSNAIVAGDDPIALLRAVADCVVSMHARACCRTYPSSYLGLSGCSVIPWDPTPAPASHRANEPNECAGVGLAAKLVGVIGPHSV